MRQREHRRPRGADHAVRGAAEHGRGEPGDAVRAHHDHVGAVLEREDALRRVVVGETRVVRDALPATPAGKIQKFRLRDLLRDAL